jgi:TrmH family RNA methyltransferase
MHERQGEQSLNSRPSETNARHFRPAEVPTPSGPPISDPNDPRLAPITQLNARAKRDRAGLVVVEGIRYVTSAVHRHLPIEKLVYSRDALVNPAWRALVADLISQGVPAIRVTPATLLALANREDPQGIIAVTRQFTQPLAMSTPAAGLCWIAVDHVQSPGNLGTLLRTAACVGAAGLIMLGDDVDPYDPGCVRASMGALFQLRIVRCGFDELLTWARRHRAVVVGTSPHAKSDYRTVHYDRPTILFLGSERKGMSSERQALCDRMVRIPIVGAKIVQAGYEVLAMNPRMV